MAENNENKNERNKIIDVTKPKNSPPMSSNIDASRVREHTLREQQALEKLRKSVGTGKSREGTAGKIKTIVAIILVIILILILITFVVLLTRTGSSEEENYDIRISMEIENKSLLTIITETGKEELRPINPGDRLAISAYARNANDYRGDVSDGTAKVSSIYVRFKIKLILNFEDRYDVLIPTITDNWYRYDPVADSAEGKKDDNFYYYCGSVAYQRPIELFSSLKVDGNAIDCEDADIGRYAQIQVLVESIEADKNKLSNNIWPTAPTTWLFKTIRGDYNLNEG